MSKAAEYDVVWPRGKTTTAGSRLAKRLDTLNGKIIAELWDWVFKGDIMFTAFEQEIKKQYPDVSFIHWREFGEIHGEHEREVLANLPALFEKFHVDAVICGVGC